MSGPIPEGSVIPADPIAAIAAGDYAQLPVLASNTREEAKTMPQFLALSPALGGVPGFLGTDAERFLLRYHFDPDQPSKLTTASFIHPQYLPIEAERTGYNARTAVLTKIVFLANRDNVLNTLIAKQSDVWYYRFDWALEAAPWNEIFGAAHGIDLPFLFGNFGPSGFSTVIVTKANERGRMALSQAMMASVAAFVRQGNPNNDSLGVEWPVWPKALVFDAGQAEKQISVRAVAS